MAKREKAQLTVVPLEELTDWGPICRGTYGDVVRLKHKKFGELTLKNVVTLKEMDERGQKRLKSSVCHLTSLSLRCERLARVIGVTEGSMKSDSLGSSERQQVFPVQGILMELAPFFSINEVIHVLYPERVPPSVLIEMLYQVSEALAFLHSVPKQVMPHCGVKPGNILVMADLSVKLADFGLGPWIEAGKKMGFKAPLDPVHTAPEVCESRRHTIPGDVFAFGISAYEVMSGTHAYGSSVAYSGVGELKRAVSSGLRPDFSVFQVNGLELPHSLWALMSQCWDADPTRRPPIEDVKVRLGTMRWPESTVRRDADKVLRLLNRPRCGDSLSLGSLLEPQPGGSSYRPPDSYTTQRPCVCGAYNPVSPIGIGNNVYHGQSVGGITIDASLASGKNGAVAIGYATGLPTTSPPGVHRPAWVGCPGGNEERWDRTYQCKKCLDSTRPVIPEDFRIVSCKLGECWRDVGRALGMEEGTLGQANLDNIETSEKIQRMLTQWKQCKGKQATLGALVRALNKAQRGQIADHLQEIYPEDV